MRLVMMVREWIKEKVINMEKEERKKRDNKINRIIKKELREKELENMERGKIIDEERMEGVKVVFIVGIFIEGKKKIVGIDDDEIVEIVKMRGEGWIVIEKKEIGEERWEKEEEEKLGVDKKKIIKKLRRIMGESWNWSINWIDKRNWDRGFFCWLCWIWKKRKGGRKLNLNRLRRVDKKCKGDSKEIY